MMVRKTNKTAQLSGHLIYNKILYRLAILFIGILLLNLQAVQVGLKQLTKQPPC